MYKHTIEKSDYLFFSLECLLSLAIASLNYVKGKRERGEEEERERVALLIAGQVCFLVHIRFTFGRQSEKRREEKRDKGREGERERE